MTSVSAGQRKNGRAISAGSTPATEQATRRLNSLW